METKIDKPKEPSQTEKIQKVNNKKQTVIKITQIKINRKIKNQHKKLQAGAECKWDIRSSGMLRRVGW